MEKALRIDRKLYLLEKPPLRPVRTFGFTEGDIVICCAGFEDRSLNILNSAISSGERNFSVVAISYLPFVTQNRIEDINRNCSLNGISLRSLVYDRKYPSSIGDKVLKLTNGKKRRIFIDVSGMSRLLIVQVLTALGNRALGFSNTTILYTMAQDYPPRAPEVDSSIERMQEDPLFSAMFLSSGVFEVCVVPELSSFSLEGQPIRLVAFPSFNPIQIAALRSEIQASFFTFIHGVPPLPENAWRPAKIRTLNRIDEISNREDYDASTLNYQETLNLLLDVYEEHGVTERIVIAPTGSKMQTVAVGILRAFMRDIQIVYPTPRVFPEPDRYTAGIREIYRLDLDAFAKIKYV